METTIEITKITKHLRRDTWNAIEEFNMLENGDKVMVCLSGGKDSYTLLDVLLHFQNTADIQFEIVAVNMDQKQPGFPEEVLPNYLKENNIPYLIVEQDTYSVVKEKIPEGKTTCSLCSRMRRGKLYATATEIGATKIALGHHRNDIIETFFLNLFFGGKLEAMPPKYKTDNGEHIVIRPLAYCKEDEIIAFAEAKQFPIIPCNLCGSQPKLQRQLVKQMIAEWEATYPDRSAIIFNALKNISPSHLLDSKLFDFHGIKPTEQSH
ncbi:MAG: tRNA 2-thiocytidine(32) synthetase TtcA [Vicingus serpentipes]|nr:tRNA 2-thiocytidine(32) synthetase TtcA [Vicingus serpentipes]